MQQYIILFYKNKKDSISSAKYYREFETFEELIEWCKSVQKECNYANYKHRVIRLSQFLENTK